MKKLIYKGDKKFRILHPVDERIEKGTVLLVDNKEFEKELLEFGFEEVQEDSKKNKKKEGE